MKKFFYLFALVAAMTLSACGGKKAVPQEIQDLTEVLKTHFDEQAGEEIKSSDAYVEDDNIICVLVLNEDMMEGKTLRSYFSDQGVDPDMFCNLMKAQILNNDIRHPERIKPLKEHKYNIVFRFVGSNSGEEMEMKIGYDELPDVE